MKRVFTCPETEDLTGVCSLCGNGIDRHNSDFECEQSYILELFDNVSGGDCVDSAAELEEITVRLLEALKDISESLDSLYKHEPGVAGAYFGAFLDGRIKDAIKKAEGR